MSAASHQLKGGNAFIGFHGSIRIPTPEQLEVLMPAAAKKDLLEWSPVQDLPCYLGWCGAGNPSQKRLNLNPEIEITDDAPLNEYYLLRQLGLLPADSRLQWTRDENSFPKTV